MKKFIVAAALSLIGFAAQAGEARPAWVCALGFEGQARGVQILVGSFKSVAYGEIRCTDLIGGEYVQPVKVTIGAEPVALNLAIGTFDFVGGAAEISLFNNQPSDLLGNYLVVQGRAAFALGAGAFTAVRVNIPNIALNISVEVMRGLGAQVGINKMRIEAIN
ncbi:MAG: hypothetical protein KF767_12275 [Bdellovibrionaceae bacterium]|nr:hypothetical protein [Pseudobdellovibrionaceae bacterium]